MGGDLKAKFLEVYSVLKSELLNDSAFEFTHDSRQWVERCPKQALNDGIFCGYYVGCFIEDILSTVLVFLGFGVLFS